MTKWPVQKQTHRTIQKTRKTPRRKRYSEEKNFFCVFSEYYLFAKWSSRQINENKLTFNWLRDTFLKDKLYKIMYSIISNHLYRSPWHTHHASSLLLKKEPYILSICFIDSFCRLCYIIMSVRNHTGSLEMPTETWRAFYT